VPVPRPTAAVLTTLVLAALWALPARAGTEGAGQERPLELPAVAHITATSARQAAVVWAAPPGDVAALARSLGVEVEPGGMLSAEQDDVLSGSAELEAALIEGVRLRVRNRTCRTLVEVTSIVTSGARLRFSCPGPVQGARLRITLLSDLDPSARTLGIAGVADGVQRVMFTAARPEHRLALDPANARLVAATVPPPQDSAELGGPFGGSLALESELVVLADRSSSGSRVLAPLLAAVLVGAAHALVLGTRLLVVAAALLAARAGLRDAALAASAVAVVHTWSVLIVGLALYVAAERPATAALSGWLELAASALVAALGLSLLVRRRSPPAAGGAQPTPAAGRWALTAPQLVAVGTAGGLLPATSTLVVLFTALADGRLAYGLSLVAAFSLGLALTVLLVGLAAILLRDLAAGATARASVRLAGWAAPLGALAVLGLGAARALRAASRLLLP
jgi:ABC-type nickel/cobalt efflux system permease component RcnA